MFDISADLHKTHSMHTYILKGKFKQKILFLQKVLLVKYQQNVQIEQSAAIVPVKIVT